MPIHDYSCRACGHRFEALVRGKAVPVCPKCRSQDLERLVSLSTVRSESTKRLGMKAAKKRDALQAREQAHEQRRYEQSHED
jgi:putative FmdB family regulatory protein